MNSEPYKVYYVAEKGEDVSTPAEATYKVNWEMKNGCMVRGALALVLRISRVCGLAPLHFQRQDSGWFITISPSICFISYVFGATLGLVSVAALVLDLSVEKEKSVRVTTIMTASVFSFELVLINVTTWLGIFAAPSRMREMIKIKEIIAKVEFNLDTERKGPSEKLMSTLVVVFLLTSVVILGSDYYANHTRTLEYNKDWRISYMYLAFFIQYETNFILEMQFVLIAFSVQLSIQAMNDAFENISQHMYIKGTIKNPMKIRKPGSLYEPMESINLLIDSLATKYNKDNLNFIGSMQLSKPHEAVRHLTSLHCLLCDVVQLINNTYGPILITLLLAFLLHLIMSPYYLILQLYDFKKRFYKLVLQFIWCIFHILNMFLTVEPCHRTINEFNRTRELASRLTRRLNSNSCQLAVQLELLSRQLMLRSVRYSPLGMCTMERRLITSIIGGVTTYLVILIQFQQLSENTVAGSV